MAAFSASCETHATWKHNLYVVRRRDTGSVGRDLVLSQHVLGSPQQERGIVDLISEFFRDFLVLLSLFLRPYCNLRCRCSHVPTVNFVLIRWCP